MKKNYISFGDQSGRYFVHNWWENVSIYSENTSMKSALKFYRYVDILKII